MLRPTVSVIEPVTF